MPASEAKEGSHKDARDSELGWTCVLPVRDTDEEYGFLLKALPSALKLNPNEMIVGIDAPASERLVNRIKKIQSQYSYSNLRVLSVEKTPDWNFQLANIMWHAYESAQYNKILSFDVDTILTKTVMIGLNDIGKDYVAVLSFTKRLRISNLSELIRYISYRMRVARSDSVFTGLYWIYKPYFFDFTVKSEYQKIYNGIDTYLVHNIPKTKYRLVTRKEIGSIMLTPANEEKPWRQFQVGVWISANDERMRDVRRELRKQRWQKPSKAVREKIRDAASKLIHVKYWDLDRFLSLNVYVTAFCWQYPYLLKGYKWAKANSEAEVVKLASKMSLYEFEMLGSKYFGNIMDWGVKGTGFVEN